MRSGFHGNQQVTDFLSGRRVEAESTREPAQNISAGDHPTSLNLGHGGLPDAGALSQHGTGQTSLSPKSPKARPERPHQILPLTPHNQGSTPQGSRSRTRQPQ